VTSQIDRGSLRFGLHVLRPDRNRLLVAACGQAQIGGKYWTLGDDLNARAFALPVHGVGSIARGFTPIASDRTPRICRADT